tara:strand:- start:480 stop:740 length:261 start_codon:yes stop_codon:yes gene_type:complete
MSRKINITKYKGNTHYSVKITDSFNQEHHLGYLDINLTMSDIYDKAEEIWQNEVKRKVNPISEIIGKMHKLSVDSGLYQSNRDGLD